MAQLRIVNRGRGRCHGGIRCPPSSRPNLDSEGGESKLPVTYLTIYQSTPRHNPRKQIFVSVAVKSHISHCSGLSDPSDGIGVQGRDCIKAAYCSVSQSVSQSVSPASDSNFGSAELISMCTYTEGLWYKVMRGTE